MVLILVWIASFHALLDPASCLDLSGSGPSTNDRNDTCRTTVRSCAPLSSASSSPLTCLGIQLPYANVTFDLVPDIVYGHEVRNRLDKLRALRVLPRCWTLLRPLLCAVYLPPCDYETMTTSLLTDKLCKIIRSPDGPCRALNMFAIDSPDWPSYLDCNDSRVYLSDDNRHCKSPRDAYLPQEIFVSSRHFGLFDSHNQSDQYSPTCMTPYMMPTDNYVRQHPLVDGCAPSCRSSHMYPDTEVHFIQRQVANLFIVGSVTLSFGAITHGLGRYQCVSSMTSLSATLICCLELTALMALFALSFQYWVAEDFVIVSDKVVDSSAFYCNDDGSAKVGNGGSNSVCTINGMLLYSSLVASCVLVTGLALVWFMSVKSSTVLRIKSDSSSNGTNEVESYRTPIYMATFCITFIITIIVLSLDLIDGDSISRVCFIIAASTPLSPERRRWSQTIAVLGPMFAMLIISAPFNGCTFGKLYSLIRKQSSMPPERRDKLNLIKSQLIRMVGFTTVVYTAVIYSAYFVIYRQSMASLYEADAFNMFVCEAKAAAASRDNFVPHCDAHHRPSAGPISIILLFAMFVCLAIFSWTCHRSTLDVWQTLFGDISLRLRDGLANLPGLPADVQTILNAGLGRSDSGGNTVAKRIPNPMSVSLPSLASGAIELTRHARHRSSMTSRLSFVSNTSDWRANSKKVEYDNLSFMSSSFSIYSVCRQRELKDASRQSRHRRSLDSLVSDLRQSEIEDLETFADSTPTETDSKSRRSKTKFFQQFSSRHRRYRYRTRSVASSNAGDVSDCDDSVADLHNISLSKVMTGDNQSLNSAVILCRALGEDKPADDRAANVEPGTKELAINASQLSHVLSPFRRGRRGAVTSIA